MINTGVHSRITAAGIEQARSRIGAEFLNSRLVENEALSNAIGARLLCKIESENPVGSFKGRGADCFVNGLPADARTIVTASAGNFGLAMAHAAKKREIAITVYAAETASEAKINRIRATGAIVKLWGKDFDDAKEHAREVSTGEAGVIFVEDGREPAITLGAGTIAAEITESGRPVNTMIVPLGNGALLAGIGCWFRAQSPKTRIIGVCAEGAPAMAFSWRSHKFQSTETVETIADGIAVRVPVPEALSDIENVVDDIVLVSDGAIKRALKIFHESLGLVVEPSGVAGLAALMSHSNLAEGAVCTPITGGNATREQLQRWIAEAE